MKKAMFAFMMIVLVNVSLAGCGSAHMKGIVLEVNENEIKLAENLAPHEDEDIKHESGKKLQKEDVEGRRDSLERRGRPYEQADGSRKGGEVDVWMDGDVLTSDPGRAQAKKIPINR